MTTERDIKNQIAYAREEGEKKGLLKVAKKFKELGTPISVISEATGLTEAEIMAL